MEPLHQLRWSPSPKGEEGEDQNPTNRAASATGFRSETTAFAGKLSSGQPSATAFMIT
jgi:hypothetical protein